jgi:hypothetical protein
MPKRCQTCIYRAPKRCQSDAKRVHTVFITCSEILCFLVRARPSLASTESSNRRLPGRKNNYAEASHFAEDEDEVDESDQVGFSRQARQAAQGGEE